jgi:hypothetical protein
VVAAALCGAAAADQSPASCRKPPAALGERLAGISCGSPAAAAAAG